MRDDDSVSATVLELWAGGCVSLSSSRREAGTVFIPRNPRALKEAGHRCLCPLSFPHTEAVCVCVPRVTKQGNDDSVASGEFLQLQRDQLRGLGSWTW